MSLQEILKCAPFDRQVLSSHASWSSHRCRTAPMNNVYHVEQERHKHPMWLASESFGLTKTSESLYPNVDAALVELIKSLARPRDLI